MDSAHTDQSGNHRDNRSVAQETPHPGVDSIKGKSENRTKRSVSSSERPLRSIKKSKTAPALHYNSDMVEVVDVELESSSQDCVEILPTLTAMTVAPSNKAAVSVQQKANTEPEAAVADDVMYVRTVIDLTGSSGRFDQTRGHPRQADVSNSRFSGLVDSRAQRECNRTISRPAATSQYRVSHSFSQAAATSHYRVRPSYSQATTTNYCQHQQSARSAYSVYQHHIQQVAHQQIQQAAQQQMLQAAQQQAAQQQIQQAAQQQIQQAARQQSACHYESSVEFEWDACVGQQSYCPGQTFPPRNRPSRREQRSFDRQYDRPQDKRRRSPADVKNKNRWDRLRNRRWEVVHEIHGNKNRVGRQANSLTFTVASYNVLAQNLLEDNRYLYTGSEEQHLSWEFRRENLLAEITHYMPDILGLQEVNSEHYENFFKPELEKLGYKGEFKKRTGYMQDGCATFYKVSVFKLDKVVPVEYFHPGVSVLDRDNVALLLQLSVANLGGQTSLVVANTHLLYNPKRGDVKLAQLMVLMAEVDRLVHPANSATSQPKEPAVIVLGDLNTVPNSKFYQLLDRGQLKYEGEVIQRFTGQEDWYGYSRIFSRVAVPKSVGITDNCQYISELKRRQNTGQSTVNNANKAKSDASSPKSETDNDNLMEVPCKEESSDSKHSDCEAAAGSPEAGMSHPTHSQEQVQTEPVPVQCTSSLEYTQSSGYVYLPLKLASVYSHRIHRRERKAVSTCHGNANCLVDYILYSVRKDSMFHEQRSKREGQLQLLERLSLLSGKEMDKFGPLPNDAVSADHLILMARFSLRL